MNEESAGGRNLGGTAECFVPCYSNVTGDFLCYDDEQIGIRLVRNCICSREEEKERSFIMKKKELYLQHHL